MPSGGWASHRRSSASCEVGLLSLIRIETEAHNPLSKSGLDDGDPPFDGGLRASGPNHTKKKLVAFIAKLQTCQEAGDWRVAAVYGGGRAEEVAAATCG
ncbi:hypothetical protein GOBAR_DD32652 [Gossypium barbadense]|nr:hypothetical protein GOBAR_DD32652 [Gossypium barbadense]